MVTQIIQMQQNIEAYLDVFLHHGWTGDDISDLKYFSFQICLGVKYNFDYLYNLF